MKKLLSVLLCAMLLIGAVPAFAVSADDTRVDLSAVADGGTYTDAKGNKYTVLKSADTIVETVKADMSANYILGADIDFNNKQFWASVFHKTENSTGIPFSGIFDGNGYSIKNFYVTSNTNATVGLIFSTIAGNAKILNLTVGAEDEEIQISVTAKSPQNVGGLVGQTKSGATATIQNVHVYTDISYQTAYSDSVRVGGIIANTDPINILDCSFHGSVMFEKSAEVSGKVTQVGGIVGRCSGDGVMNIVNCKNYATLDATARPDNNNNAKPSMGGMIGTSTCAINVRNCENYGTLNGENQTGGIVGRITGAVNTENAHDIVGCRNYGAINGELYVGGIVGGAFPSSESDSPSYSYSISILNCLNAGNVTQYATLEAKRENTGCAVGGIAGYIKRGYNVIDNCASVGNITGNGKSGNSSTANGLFGRLFTNQSEERRFVITNCYATGLITPASSDASVYVTGAIGVDKMIYNPFVSNCYGTITLPENHTKLNVYPSSNITKENYGDYTYVEPAAVTATEVSDGTLLLKLGAGFAQNVGTDAYPVPVQPAYVFDAGTENYFSNGEAGYYSDAGVWTNNSSYSTKRDIPVSKDMVITVGALSTDQVTLGHLSDENKASVKKLTAQDMTLVADLGNSYGIYSITIPEGVSYLSITTFSRRAYITLLTLNEEFDADGYYDYFGIEPMTGDSSSPLWRKSALFIGDSICYGHTDTAVNGKILSYGGRIAYNYDMEWVNAGVSGATLTTESNKIIIDQLEGHESKEFDYVIVEGGKNDARLEVKLGEISSGLSSPLDVTSYVGALEYTLKTVINTYPEAKVGFLLSYSTPRNESEAQYKTYPDVTKKVCEKWGVGCLDMYSNEEINGENVLDVNNVKSPYLPDGIHPSAEGYVNLCPYIESFMETLSVPVPDASGDSTPPSNDPPANQNPSDGGTTDTPEDPPEDTEEETGADEEKKGCGSLIGAPIMLMSALSLGVAATGKKRKDKK